MKSHHSFSLITFVALIVLGLTFAPQATAQQPGPGQAGGQCAGGIGALFHEIEIEPLSAEEEDELLFMWEEEKMARDVYLTLAEKWQLPIFANIARAEQRHMDLMFRLVEAYGFSDRVPEDVPGVFFDPDLGPLYELFVSEERNTTLVDSLKVGAEIEDKDLADLYYLIDYVTDNKHIELVAYNLAKGSRNHLRAFVRALAAQGETYTATIYLDQTTIDAIVEAGVEQRMFYNADGEPIPACGGSVGGFGMRRGQVRRGGQGHNGSGTGECDGSGSASADCDGSGPHGGGNGSGSGNQGGN